MKRPRLFERKLSRFSNLAFIIYLALLCLTPSSLFLAGMGGLVTLLRVHPPFLSLFRIFSNLRNLKEIGIPRVVEILLPLFSKFQKGPLASSQPVLTWLTWSYTIILLLFGQILKSVKVKLREW